MDENELGRICLRMSKYGYVREWVSMDMLEKEFGRIWLRMSKDEYGWE